TGLAVPILGFGGYDIGKLGEAEAVAVVEASVEAGLTYLDTASSYDRSEEWIGRALKGVDRSRVIIATKALKRSRDEARREIERSLRRLRTDRLDLLQLHAVNQPWILRKILKPDGALAAAVEFHEAGHIAHIGITGHRRPSVLVEALKAYPFATALIPVSPVDAQLYDFARPLEAAAQRDGIGLIAMKVLADGALAGRAQRCIRYALSWPVACAIVGMRSVAQVGANVAAARAFRPMTTEERARLEAEVHHHATLDTLWWKR
ncbi:MAG: aldo/keto reductase, partial [Candidatus Tectimicrobiota bacterium]